MAIDPKVIGGIVKQVSDVALSSKGQQFLCGTYSDGKPRSFVDAMRDEYVSPKDRERWEKQKKKKKKKKKKGKKGKKKLQAQNLDIFRF